MTSFYNLSKADPAIADSGGVQFVGQRGHLLGQGSAVALSQFIPYRECKARSSVIRVLVLRLVLIGRAVSCDKTKEWQLSSVNLGIRVLLIKLRVLKTLLFVLVCSCSV